MHFITFPVSSTNIFPLVNSKSGGQLMSEYNIRSLDSVATDPEVTYFIGPSFTHSMQDFEVSLLSGMDAPTYDSKEGTYKVGDYCCYNDVTYVCIYPVEVPQPFDSNKWNKISLSTSILQVSSGRAIVNGHFVESLAPVTIDLTLANAQLKQASRAPLSGELSIGFRTYYSTETTMAGSMLVENEDNMYLGIQLVVMPKDEFITPSDSPTDRNSVTADLKLADFVYINGSVSSVSIKQNPNKISYLPARRIGDFEDVLSTNYISKSALDPNKMYVFSGLNGSDNNNGWCQANEALMVWDKLPVDTTEPPLEGEAIFVTDSSEQVHLRIPHKQLHRTNTAGEDLYFKTKDLSFPKADYALGTPGTITSEYTAKIKEIAEKLTTYKTFVNGKQIMYVEQMDEEFKTNELPQINIEDFNEGDYILVGQDYTATAYNDTGAPPSTMYVVLPGYITELTFRGTEKPNGICLDKVDNGWEGDNTNPPTAEDPDDEELNRCTNYTSTRASIGDYYYYDYFSLDGTFEARYYWEVTKSGLKTWSDAILITGGIPYASTTAVGGFKNVDTTATDQGYVYRDENGRLKLLDYSLLRSGTLAYQLGEDYTIPAGMDAESIQIYLDEYVNSRVAFPFTNTLGPSPNMINVYINLPEGLDNVTSINIYNIDSRFGTGVYLHFLGAATSSTVINIIDCEMVRIDPNIDTSEGTPIINVIRSNLYYDASVFSYIRSCDVGHIRSSSFTGFLDIKIWYDKFDDTDPDLLVCGMEVSQPNVPMTSQDIDFWSTEMSNDNHYGCALRSVTFDGKGDIVACSLYVSNNTTLTNNTDPTIIGGKFIIPQGSDLNYPIESITHALKVTGSFTTAYFSESDNKWIVSDTSFTALSGIYSEALGVSDGTISFYSKPAMISPVYTNVDTIDGWKPGSYHIFYGGVII